MRTASIVAAALVLSACGGDRPAAPELTAGPGVPYDDVLVAWTVPGSRPDRFELQARLARCDERSGLRRR